MSAAAHYRRKQLLKKAQEEELESSVDKHEMLSTDQDVEDEEESENTSFSYQNQDRPDLTAGVVEPSISNNVTNPPNRIVATVWPPRGRSYRGFTTSICDMFRNRNDCCAFACCGMLSYDRTRYLLTGEHPPSIAYRVSVHFMIPLLIFVVAGFCAVNIADHDLNEVISALLILMLVLYIVNDCLSVRQERVLQRRDILEKVGRRSEQSDDDIRRAHGLCLGCYSTDGHWDHWGTEGDSSRSDDACTTLWGYFAKLFCGICTGCFCQFCGICALAQEAREMDNFVDPRDIWIDYVTFEDFSCFFRKIVELRISENHNLWDHYSAVSKLSRILVKTLNLVVLSLIFLSFMKFNTLFTYQNVLVLIATFIQAFLILYFVHWKWNKFDLSLDAIIKYFASGFLLSTGISIAFELAMSVILQVLLYLLMAVTGGVSSDDVNSTPQGTSTRLAVYGVHHPLIVIFYLFLNSFVVAATVEEICKYFGYLMVTHPDFMIEEADSLLESPTQQIPENQSDDSEHEISDRQQNQSSENQRTLVVPQRSLSSIGAGITIAMVSVALGFQCCENLLYIFIYTGDDIESEISVLVARSLFPVHPLAAAIQSIAVCRHNLEGEQSTKIGRTILPAIILHGSFDFTLMLTSFLYDMNYAKIRERGQDVDEDYGSGAITILLSFTIVLLGVGYYYSESKKQKERLTNYGVSTATLV